jgi:hypothetical protein
MKVFGDKINIVGRSLLSIEALNRTERLCKGNSLSLPVFELGCSSFPTFGLRLRLELIPSALVLKLSDSDGHYYITGSPSL